MSENKLSDNQHIQDPLTTPELHAQNKNWVQFDNEERGVEAAVIPTENVQVSLERSTTSSTSDNRTILTPNNLSAIELPSPPIETIQQGFSNGDIIVTLLPINTRFPWITPAKFRAELVPEELMAHSLTLTVEEYAQIMENLINDHRFVIYNMCYKRILVVWITLAFIILLGLLFSGITGLAMFGLGMGWLIFNIIAIFTSIWVKFKLRRRLEICLAQVNKQFLRHKIVLTVDDRGKISCHKVNLCFIYMNPSSCIERLRTCAEQNKDISGWEQTMDIPSGAIMIQSAGITRLTKQEEKASLLYLRYISRWGKERVNGYLASPPAKGGRHCAQLSCPCQYIEDHIQSKAQVKLSFSTICCPPDQDYARNNCMIS